MADLHRIPLRISPELVEEIAFLAKLRGRSINAELTAATEAWVATHRTEIDTVREEVNRLNEQIQEPLAQIQEAIAQHNANWSNVAASLPAKKDLDRMMDSVQKNFDAAAASFRNLPPFPKV